MIQLTLSVQAKLPSIDSLSVSVFSKDHTTKGLPMQEKTTLEERKPEEFDWKYFHLFLTI